MKPGENTSINAVRTIAALLVVMEHVRALMFQDWDNVPHTALNAAFYFITGLGADAVVVFFVLSGFWVGGSVLRSVGRGQFQWREYFISRGSRLWIALVPAVALTAVLASIGVATFSWTDILSGHPGYHSLVTPEIGDTITPLVLLGNLFFLQGIAVPVVGTNGPLWSLAYEFWYYILFPAILIAVLRGSAAKRLLHGVVALAIALMVGPDILALFPVWLVGVLVAYYQSRISAFLDGLSARAAILRVLTALFLLASVATAEVLSWPAPLSAWAVALPSALFISTLVKDTRLDSPWFAPLRGAANYAQASYSLYVTHLPIAIFAFALLLPFASDRFSPSPAALLAYAIALMALLAFGWAFAWATEFRTPWLRRTLNRIIPGRKHPLEQAHTSVP